MINGALKESKNEMEDENSSILIMPETCLAYRKVFMQHIISKLQESDKYLPEMLALLDISIQKILYNQPPVISNKYCAYARQVWARDPDITKKKYDSGKKSYPLTPHCEKEFSKFEGIVFDDFGPAEKNKIIDEWGVLVLQGKKFLIIRYQVLWKGELGYHYFIKAMKTKWMMLATIIISPNEIPEVDRTPVNEGFFEVRQWVIMNFFFASTVPVS